jgi:hypothetical protein
MKKMKSDSSGFERLEKTVAMLLVHSMSGDQATKAMALSRAGFGNPEIAEFFGTSPGAIAQQLYELRRGKTKKRARRK